MERAKKSSKGGLRKRMELEAWLFISPVIIGLGIFTLFPVVVSFIISFTDHSILEPGKFIGLKNFYKLLFQDPDSWRAFFNTAYFVIVSVPLSMSASLLLAIAMNQELKLVTWYRAVYFIPVVSSWIAVGLIWRWLYNPDFGLINHLLLKVGINGPPWLTSHTWAMPAIIVVNAWKILGFNMMLYLAGLQGIPEQFYEAAKIDGANWWHVFKHITLPMLSPTTFFVLVMSIIGSTQIFAAVYIMSMGGPERATSVVVYYIWENGFSFFKMGYAAAISWILFLIIFILTFIQWKLKTKWVFAE